jgi:DNA-binding winged helix-turn-helix (wHTH) protein
MGNVDRDVFSFDGYILDLTRGCVRNADREIELRPKSFELLHYLVTNAGRLIAKDELGQCGVAEYDRERCLAGSVRQRRAPRPQ